MWPVFPLSQTLTIVAVLFVVALTSARLLQPHWWQSRAVRLVTFAALPVMLAGVAVWAIGAALGRHGTALEARVVALAPLHDVGLRALVSLPRRMPDRDAHPGPRASHPACARTSSRRHLAGMTLLSRTAAAAEGRSWADRDRREETSGFSRSWGESGAGGGGRAVCLL